MKQKHIVYLLLAVGLMTVGQVPAGIYLPAMITMSHYFHVSQGQIQYIVGIYLLFYGGSQLIYGPISDHYGRRPTAIIGLLLFAVGSMIAIVSKTIEVLYLGSAIQGLSLGSVAVVSTAVMRDLHNDKKLLISASYLSAATIVTPLAAPIIGSYLLMHFGWRSTFIFQLVYSLGILILVTTYFTETNQNVQKKLISVTQVCQNYITVLKTGSFLSYGLCRVLVISGGTAYAATSPFLYQSLLHFSPVAYAWLCLVPASGFFIGSFMAKRLGKTLAVENIVRIGALFALVGSVSLLFLNSIMPLSLLTIMLPMIIYKCGSGIIYPSAITGAILPLGALAGTATAMVGSFQNLGRGFFSSFVGYFYTHSIEPLAITITVLTALSMMISLFLKDRAQVREPA